MTQRPEDKAQSPLSPAQIMARIDRGADLLEQGDNNAAVQVLTPAAEAGDLSAMHNLGIAYMRRGSVDEAITWYTRSAEVGNVDAMAYVGYIHHLRGDVGRAREWYTRAAGYGHASATDELRKLDLEPSAIVAAQMKFMGDQTASMGLFDKAEQYWMTAAQAGGDSDAMVKLGALKFREGNLGEAVLWYARASDAGDIEAREFLARIRPTGNDLTPTAADVTHDYPGLTPRVDESGAIQPEVQNGGRVVAVALGSSHGLALKGDGTVVTWGESYRMPAGLADVTAIAAGHGWSLALKRDGTVAAWGNSTAGATDVPRGLTGVVKIAAGMGHCLALRRDGTVVAWGLNLDGQADVPYGLSDVKAIAAGTYHSLALRRDGSVVAWGHPDSDQRQVPYGLAGAVGIAAGAENSSAILADGTVIDWGPDSWFDGVPAEFLQVSAIAYGSRVRVALRSDGTVVADGWGKDGLRIPADLTDVVAVAGATGEWVSHRSFLALKHDGSVVVLRSDQDDRPSVNVPALDLPDELTLSSATAVDPESELAEPTDPRTIPMPSRVPISNESLQHGKTPLMAYASAGDEAQVQALIDQGGDIRAVDDDGDGVLSYAMFSGNARVLGMLLKAGADPDAASSSAIGGSGQTVLHVLAQRGWDEGVELLLRHGADVNAETDDGITPLMIAAGAGSDPCVKSLVDAGADVNAVDSDGDSVLYYAASNGQKSTVSKLLALGADADPRAGASGQTPLSIAAQAASPFGQRATGVPPSDYTDIVLSLLRAGADPTTMYESGYVLQHASSGLVPLSLLGGRITSDNHLWSVAQVTQDGLQDPALRRIFQPAPKQAQLSTSPIGGTPDVSAPGADTEDDFEAEMAELEALYLEDQRLSGRDQTPEYSPARDHDPHPEAGAAINQATKPEPTLRVESFLVSRSTTGTAPTPPGPEPTPPRQEQERPGVPPWVAPVLVFSVIFLVLATLVYLILLLSGALG